MNPDLRANLFNSTTFCYTAQTWAEIVAVLSEAKPANSAPSWTLRLRHEKNVSSSCPCGLWVEDRMPCCRLHYEYSCAFKKLYQTNERINSILKIFEEWMIENFRANERKNLFAHQLFRMIENRISLFFVYSNARLFSRTRLWNLVLYLRIWTREKGLCVSNIIHCRAGAFRLYERGSRRVEGWVWSQTQSASCSSLFSVWAKIETWSRYNGSHFERRAPPRTAPYPTRLRRSWFVLAKRWADWFPRKSTLYQESRLIRRVLYSNFE